MKNTMTSTTRKNSISSIFSHLNSFFPMFFPRGLPVYRICHGWCTRRYTEKEQFHGKGNNRCFSWENSHHRFYFDLPLRSANTEMMLNLPNFFPTWTASFQAPMYPASKPLCSLDSFETSNSSTKAIFLISLRES